MTSTMTVELTIGGNTKRSTTGQHPVKVEFHQLPDASQDFIIRYGLKQYLADGTAGATSVEEAATGVNDRLAKLISGDLTRTRGDKEPVDTVETRAVKIVKGVIAQQAKAKGVKLSKEQVAATVKAVMDNEDKAKQYRAQAKKELDQLAKFGEDDDILAGIIAAAE